MSRVGSIGIGGLTGVAAAGLNALTDDIELLLAAVQLRRADMIEDQLRQQIETVQGRNKSLEQVNTVKADLATQKSYFNGDTTTGELIDQSHYDPSKYSKIELQRAYANNPEDALARAMNGEFGPQGKELAALAQSMRTAGFEDSTVFKVASGKITHAELDAAMTSANTKADSLSSSQQQDMLRLQILQQRRNESFDIVTNTYKKIGDSRSSIVSNMR